MRPLLATLALPLALATPSAALADTWVHALRRLNRDDPVSVARTADGYLLGVEPFGNGGPGANDFGAIKLDELGEVQWQFRYGTEHFDNLQVVVPTADGGAVMAGGIGVDGAAGEEAWVVKLAASGSIDWQRKFGDGVTQHQARAILPTSDGGYAVVGV